MAKVYNLVRVSSTTAGTGTITLGTAVTGFITWASAGAVDGDVVEYSINDGANSEKGSGTYNSSATATITRTNIYTSTNSNNAINLSGLSSTCNIFCDPSAQNLWVINTDQHTLYGGI